MRSKMSKLDYLTDMKDYCVCENLNLGKKQQPKTGVKADRKLNIANKKNNARQKYEFPEKKFQQLERFFLNPPRKQIKVKKNKERSKDNNKPKRIPKPQAQQHSHKWHGNQQCRDHNKAHGQFIDTQIINCDENRLQLDPSE